MTTPIAIDFYIGALQQREFRATLLSDRQAGWFVWHSNNLGYYIKDGIYINNTGSYEVEDFTQTVHGEIRFFVPTLLNSSCLLAPPLGLFVGTFSEIHTYLSDNSYAGYHIIFFDTVTGHGIEKDITGMILAADPQLYPANRRHLQFSVETIFSSMQKIFEETASVQRLDGSLESFPGIQKDPGAKSDVEKWLRYAAAMFFSLAIKL